MQHLSYIEINTNALRANVAQFRRLLPRDNRLIAVVKANAYGHGIREVMESVDEIVDGFQVDDLLELSGARKYTQKQIYVFGYVAHHEMDEVIELGGILGLYDEERIMLLNDIARAKNKVIPFHLKIDAQLGRQGVMEGGIEKVLAMIKKCAHIKLEAIYAHFSNIEDTEDLVHATLQHDLLLNIKKVFVSHGLDIVYHISATSGILADQKYNWGGGMLRLGIGLYGLWPSDSLRTQYEKEIVLTPALRWVSHIAQVKTVPTGYPIGYGLTHVTNRETTVAIVPQGYSDGFDRRYSNKGEVLVGGKKCPVLGRVMMNMIVVDVTEVNGVKAEDEVILLGIQGNEAVTAEDMATHIGTINYEIVARISPLLPRRVI